MSDSQLFQATPLFQAMFPRSRREIMTDEELAEAMRKRDAQMHADLCYDRETEARSFNRRDNPHDE